MPYKDPEKAREASRKSGRKWRSAHPDKRFYSRRRYSWKRQGIADIDEAERRLREKIENPEAMCDLCHKVVGTDKWVIEHDSGETRGVVHERCNRLLGANDLTSLLDCERYLRHDLRHRKDVD